MNVSSSALKSSAMVALMSFLSSDGSWVSYILFQRVRIASESASQRQHFLGCGLPPGMARARVGRSRRMLRNFIFAAIVSAELDFIEQNREDSLKSERK